MTINNSMIPLLGGDPAQQTWLVVFWLVVGVIVTAKPRMGDSIFPTWLTAEIKGLAMLSIVFGHIGYFLISDHQFLAPLSNFSGIGVDLFFITSGFGLTVSAMKRSLSVKEFYQRRLSKVIMPVTIAVLILLLLDAVILHRLYSLQSMILSLVGIFPRADLWADVNSPLWFITPLLFWYLVFPFLFYKRAPWILPLACLSIGLIFTQPWLLGKLPLDSRVVDLYQLHSFGFGLGTLLGVILPTLQRYVQLVQNWLQQRAKFLPSVMYAVLGGVALMGLWYVATLSTDGYTLNQYQLVSLIASGLLILVMMLKPVQIRLWFYIGVFSFDIYLAHWPLFSRYDFLFHWLPSGIATLVYLGLFLGISFGYRHAWIFIKRNIVG